jgi:hypothetical protein
MSTRRAVARVKGRPFPLWHIALLTTTIPDVVAPASFTKAEQYGAHIGEILIKSWCDIFPNAAICNGATTPRNYSARALNPVGAVSEFSTALGLQLDGIKGAVFALHQTAAEVRRLANRYPNGGGDSSDGYGRSFPKPGTNPQLAYDEGFSVMLDSSWDTALSQFAAIEAIKFGSINGHLRMRSRRLSAAAVGDPRMQSWCGR